jgi:dTMP kinase
VHNSRHHFIVLEGVDLSGKTTLAPLLANELGAKLLKSPPAPFDAIKTSVLENASSFARLLYFLAANLEVSRIITGVLKHQPVICDRYVWSTIAYHSAIENSPETNIDNILSLLINSLAVPDLVVLLRVNRQAQLLRAQNKYDDPFQQRLLSSEDFQKSLDTAYENVNQHFKAPCIKVDTSYRPIAETVNIVTAEIKKRLNI